MDEPRWLDADEREAWLALCAVNLLLPAALDAHLTREAALTNFSYFVLAMLSEAPGRSTTMSHLAARSNSSPSRLSHVVSKLEERGWVQRRQSEQDKRVINITMTDVGWQALVRIAPEHVTEVRRLVFDALDGEDVRHLAEIGAKILGVLDPERAFGPTR